MFYPLVYFQIESEIAVKSYKQYLFVPSQKNPCSVSLTMFLVHHPPIKMMFLSNNLAKYPDHFPNVGVTVLQCSNSKVIFKLKYKYKYVMKTRNLDLGEYGV